MFTSLNGSRDPNADKMLTCRECGETALRAFGSLNWVAELPIRIDLRTRTLPEEPDVFLVRPGASYHLYDSVRRSDAIAVDVPFLEVPNGQAVPAASEIQPMLERGRVLRNWAGQSESKRGPQPSRSLDSYRTFLDDRGPKMARTKLRNAANTVLWDIPDNSLLFIPASTLGGRAILAEAGKRKAPRETVYGSGSRSRMVYLARPLVDVAEVPMRDLPPEVTDPGQKLLVHNQFEGYAKERLLRTYYGDYSRGQDVNVVEFVAGSEEFDTKVIAQVSALAMSIEHFVTSREFISPEEFVFGYPDMRGPQLHARINSSDGKAQVQDSTLVPHVVKALLLLSGGAIAGAVVAASLVSGDVSIENSALQGGGNIAEASQLALIDYAAAAGTDSMASIVENLRASIERSEGEVDGRIYGP